MFEGMWCVVNGIDKVVLIVDYACEYLVEMLKLGFDWGVILWFIMGMFE